MELFKNIKQKDWSTMVSRPTIDKEQLDQIVNTILKNVKEDGDNALRAYTQKFDNVDLAEFLVSEAEIQKAKKLVSKELMQAINIAKQNIEKFHKSQFIDEQGYRNLCWCRMLEKISCY